MFHAVPLNMALLELLGMWLPWCELVPTVPMLAAYGLLPAPLPPVRVKLDSFTVLPTGTAWLGMVTLVQVLQRMAPVWGSGALAYMYTLT